MGRISERAKYYRKGKAGKGYWGDEMLKDLLADLRVAYKSWGEEWYSEVRCGNYRTAKSILEIVGKGEFLEQALTILDELIERSITYTVCGYSVVTGEKVTTDIFHTFNEAYVFAKAMACDRFKVVLEEPDGSILRF